MPLRELLFSPVGRDPPTATPVRRRPAFDLSLTGLVYALLMMFMGVAAVNTQASLLFGVFGLMIGILLVSVSISRVTLKGLGVVRRLPEAGAVGEALTLTYEFQNRKRFWPTISLTLAELDGAEAFTRQPQAYLLHAAAGASVSVPVSLLPKRRGVYALRRFQISTSFPFGFIKRAAERSPSAAGGPPADAGAVGDPPPPPVERHWWARDPAGHVVDTLVVYPPVGRVDPHVLALCQPAETTGSTLRPRRGGADELYGLKEYQAGESPRMIHWRRSARTGRLVTREMTQVSPPRLLLLVDTCRAGDTRPAFAAVEEAIAMAASVAHVALEQGLSVGALAWGGRAVDAAGPVDGNVSDGWHGVAATRGKRQRRDLMTVLARLPANAERGPAELLERAQEVLDPGTTAVLFTPAPAEVAVAERLRASLVSLVAGSPEARAWFHFPDGTAFDRCLPADQEPAVRLRS